MPEWKSFTVGGDDAGQPASNGPSFFSIPESELSKKAEAHEETERVPAPQVDELAAKWGTDVEPVSVECIERVVEGDGLPHGSSEFMVVTELNGHRFQIHREPVDSPWLQIEARIDLSDEDQSFSPYDLRQAANEWNTKHLQPTVFPVQTNGRWGFILATRFFVGEGLSDRQIHTMVRRGLSVAVQAMQEIPGRLSPDAD